MNQSPADQRSEIAFSRNFSIVLVMPLRILLLCVFAAALSSCSDYFDGAGQPQMRQEARTNPLGQTTYTYKKEDPAPENQNQ
jgi:hypothetical protein